MSVRSPTASAMAGRAKGLDREVVIDPFHQIGTLLRRLRRIIETSNAGGHPLARDSRYFGGVSMTEWLLDGDPAIRWQVMRDLTDEPPGGVATERSRVAFEGWGARLLALQGDDGQWGGGAYSPKWTSTTFTLLLLRHLGLDPKGDPTRKAIGRVRERVAMGRAGWPFFAYRGETCITGMVLALAAYFGEAGEETDQVVDWLLAEQLEDGGWNCDTARGSTRSSFNTTISVLEGLLEYEQARAGRMDEVGDARARAQEYLLVRRMFRSLRTGEVVNPRWTLFSFPPRWHYDVLRGLEYLRSAGVTPDERCVEAIALLEKKRAKDGRVGLAESSSGQGALPNGAGTGKAQPVEHPACHAGAAVVSER